MPSLNVIMGNFPTGGPYAYTLSKNGVGVKAQGGLANVATAWNAIRDDLAANLGSETVVRVVIDVQTLTP